MILNHPLYKTHLLSLGKKGGFIRLSPYTIIYLRLQTYSEFNTLLDWKSGLFDFILSLSL